PWGVGMAGGTLAAFGHRLRPPRIAVLHLTWLPDRDGDGAPKGGASSRGRPASPSVRAPSRVASPAWSGRLRGSGEVAPSAPQLACVGTLPRGVCSTLDGTSAGVTAAGPTHRVRWGRADAGCDLAGGAGAP